MLMACMAGGRAEGREIRLVAQLIWGTDQPKPGNAQLKDISPALRDKLRKVFKWKNYFEVHQQTITLPKQAGQKIRMSPKCELEFTDAGQQYTEVKLYGEGRLVVKKRQAIIPGEPMVVAGDDKNNNAWFVVITSPKP